MRLTHHHASKLVEAAQEKKFVCIKYDLLMELAKRPFGISLQAGMLQVRYASKPARNQSLKALNAHVKE